MMKLIDLTFHSNNEFKAPLNLLGSQRESLGYVDFINERLDVQVVKHLDYSGVETVNNVKYCFFKGRNHFGFTSFRTLGYLKAERPDFVLVQGFIFPIQLMLLRLFLGNFSIIMVQHHGEQPFTWPKRVLQKIADHFISGYIFTSLGNAKQWIEKKVISNSDKCFEVQAASTDFEKQDKDQSKIKLGITGDFNFIWVGRLNANKDPLTVLDGFEKYLHINPKAKLFMIYQTEELLPVVKTMINKSELLKAAVYLKGKVEHEIMPDWYSAADVYISGSHNEGCGFALIEAIACGCIPVVTNIPSFRKITADGRYGMLYEPGESSTLFESLKKLNDMSIERFSASIVDHFKKELSFKAIADRLYEISTTLKSK